MRQFDIYDKPLLRMVVKGILYHMQIGCHWRDLPSVFSLWNSVYQQFNRWSVNNKLMGIFKALVTEPDQEVLL